MARLTSASKFTYSTYIHIQHFVVFGFFWSPPRVAHLDHQRASADQTGGRLIGDRQQEWWAAARIQPLAPDFTSIYLLIHLFIYLGEGGGSPLGSRSFSHFPRPSSISSDCDTVALSLCVHTEACMHPEPNFFFFIFETTTRAFYWSIFLFFTHILVLLIWWRKNCHFIVNRNTDFFCVCL